MKPLVALAYGLALAVAMTLALTLGPLPDPGRPPSPTPRALVTPRPVAPAPPPPSTIAPTAPRAISRIVDASFYSDAMGAPRSFQIYLPPSYELAPQRGYPVLYLLHGDDGHLDSWASMGLKAKMDEVAAGGGPELIVVMPDGSGRYGDLTDWANRWDGTDRVEDQVLELIGVVDQEYRTLADRSTRFIGGLSSGGFGALNLALRHPNLFGAAMSFSGFISASDREADSGVFGTDPGYLEQNSPSARVASQPAAAGIYFVLSGGARDWYFRNRMTQFSAELDGLKIAHEFHTVPGGHDGIAWNAGLDYGLKYLARLGLRPRPLPPAHRW